MTCIGRGPVEDRKKKRRKESRRAVCVCVSAPVSSPRRCNWRAKAACSIGIGSSPIAAASSAITWQMTMQDSICSLAVKRTPVHPGVRLLQDEDEEGTKKERKLRKGGGGLACLQRIRRGGEGVALVRVAVSFNSSVDRPIWACPVVSSGGVYLYSCNWYFLFLFEFMFYHYYLISFTRSGICACRGNSSLRVSGHVCLASCCQASMTLTECNCDCESPGTCLRLVLTARGMRCAIACVHAASALFERHDARLTLENQFNKIEFKLIYFIFLFLSHGIFCQRRPDLPTKR